jgi:uncharacterized Fe-S cluster-containing radical SAM superfamily protein
MLNCRETSQLVSESQDRKLGWAEWLGMRLHLMICRNCQAFERQLRLLRQWLSRGEPDDVGPPLTEQARNRISDALRESAAEEGTSTERGDPS